MFAVGLGVAAGTVMAQLQAILSGMHPPGGPAGNAGSLWGFVPSAGHARDIVDAWEAHADGPGYHSPEFVLWSFVVVDSVAFVLAYAIILFAVLSWLRATLAATIAALPPDASDEDTRRRSLLNTYRRLVVWAWRLIPVLIVADLLENILTLAVYYSAGSSDWYRWLVYPAFWIAATAKWVLAVLIVVPAIVGLLSLPQVSMGAAGRAWRAVLVARPQVLLLVLFAAAMFVSDQSADALRLWRDEGSHAVSSVVLTVLLAFVLLVTTWRLLYTFIQFREPPPSNRGLAITAALVGVAALLGELAWDLGKGLFVLAGILAAVAFFSALTPPSVTPPPRDWTIGAALRWLPPVIAAAPLVLLGTAVLYAAVPEFAYSLRDWQWFAALGLLGVVLQVTGWTLAVRGHELLPDQVEPQQQDAPHWQNRLLLVAFVVVAYIAWRVIASPWRTSEVLGTHGVFVAAMVAAALIVFYLATLAEASWPPRAFVVLRVHRTPVFVLLLIWAVGATAVDNRGVYYDARVPEASERAAGIDRSTLTARTAFAEWQRELGPGTEPEPMLFVAAAGGGIRAAYWTSVALTCLLEGQGQAIECGEGEGARGTAFALSGISGGSLGLAGYTAHVRSDRRPDWFDERLEDDYSAPLVGWGLFVDAPLSLVRRDGGTDRAEVLERAWERSWVEPDDDSLGRTLFGGAADTDESEFAGRIFDRWAAGEHFPLLLLNGTKVQDGCRFNASVLALSVDGRDAGEDATTERLIEDCLALRLFESDQPFYVPPRPTDPQDVKRDDWALAATDDLSDYLCAGEDAEDLRLSTAVLLSARFPWVASSGRIEKCKRGRAINIVDGGYFDTSGASPVVELWSELEQHVEEHNATPGNRCIVPLYIQIDTGYADPVRGRGRAPLEWGVPVRTVRSARDAREANARQAAALAFSGPIPGRKGDEANLVDRFAHIYPRAHPGSKAPLGWTLSSTAREDLKRQLYRNAAEIKKVRGWLSGGLRCPPALAE